VKQPGGRPESIERLQSCLLVALARIGVPELIKPGSCLLLCFRWPVAIGRRRLWCCGQRQDRGKDRLGVRLIGAEDSGEWLRFGSDFREGFGGQRNFGGGSALFPLGGYGGYF
jgi:hypothetical protein